MIKQFGRLFSAYPVQSVHAPLNLLIRFRLAVRGHHDWPDKGVIRQLAVRWISPTLHLVAFRFDMDDNEGWPAT